MATLAAAERQKYREKQKEKPGYAAGSSVNPPLVVEPPFQEEVHKLSPKAGVETSPVADTAHPPPTQEVPLAKRQRVGPPYELGLPSQGEATIDVAWKQVLKCQKRADVLVDAPVGTIFDSRYLLNTILNVVARKGDVDRVNTLGMQQTMVAVKSYGHYISILTHLAEQSFNKIVAEHRRLEEEWRKTDEELRECKAERGR